MKKISEKQILNSITIANFNKIGNILFENLIEKARKQQGSTKP